MELYSRQFGHQVNVTVSGNHLTTPSLILGPTGRLVPGNPSDDANGSGPSHVIMLMGWSKLVQCSS